MGYIINEWLDYYGHIFYIFCLLGTFGLAQQRIWGWVLALIGDIGWVVLGFYMGMTSIWFWGIVFCCLQIYGLTQWIKKRKESDDNINRNNE